jgi:hypothetical protein
MSTNYLFAEVNVPGRKNTRPHYFFIVDNPVCSFEFGEDIEEGVYRFSYEGIYKLRNETDNYNSETASAEMTKETNKLMASGRTTVLVDWDRDMIKAFKYAAEDFYKYFASRWVFVSFFHDDIDTRKLPVSDPDFADPIEEKAEYLLDMGEFSFIKKVEIPLNATLSLDYIKELFHEYARP